MNLNPEWESQAIPPTTVPHAAAVPQPALPPPPPPPHPHPAPAVPFASGAAPQNVQGGAAVIHAPKGVQQGGIGIPSPAGDSLTLLPEVAATGRPAGTRRPFQRRRRSRACDACRARKTKCDTPDQGPCSACSAASLICKFSEGGEDRRRAGPARRVRALEAQVQELTKKLAEAELRLSASSNEPPYSPATPRRIKSSMSPSSDGVSHDYRGSNSSTESTAESARYHGSPRARHEWWNSERGDRGSHTSSLSRRFSLLSEPAIAGAPTSGFGANPAFIESYKDYIRRLGYNPTHMEHRNQPENAPPRVPLISEYPSMSNDDLPLDLRVFLPPKIFAEKVLEVFRRTIQNYTPMFYWPVLKGKFERLWSKPLWEQDVEAVKSVFSVIMMVLACACQMVEPEELEGIGGAEWAFTHERTGWKFFHLGRKYCDWNSPVYTLDDATFLLLMALYLDNASLPSPCWMISGACARVCQDLNLDRRSSCEQSNEIERECRNRLFWAAFIQDRKASLKKGRRMIFRDADIDIDVPRILESEIHSPRTSGVASGTVPLSERVAGAMADQEVNVEKSLQIMMASINVSRLCELIVSVTLRESGGSKDKQILQDVDEKLKKAWELYPPDLTHLQSMDVLDIGAIRPLFFLQYCRLILYRYFTDFNPRNTPHAEFRLFCLAQSIQVSKITAHLLQRAGKTEAFDRCFGLRTDELVHIQTFRAAIILLLGLNTREPSLLPVSKEEVDVCIRGMRSAARYHFSGQKLLHMFEGFAKMFNYDTDPYPSHHHGRSESPTTPYRMKIEPRHAVDIPPDGQAEQHYAISHPQWDYTHAQNPLMHAQYQPQLPWDPHTPLQQMHGQQQQQHHQNIGQVAPMNFLTRGFTVCSEPGMSNPINTIDWDVVHQALQFDNNLENYMSSPLGFSVQ